MRPAPDLAGEKRPPGAGRALAGPFGGPSGESRCRGVAKAMAFANAGGEVGVPPYAARSCAASRSQASTDSGLDTP